MGALKARLKIKEQGGKAKRGIVRGRWIAQVFAVRVRVNSKFLRLDLSVRALELE